MTSIVASADLWLEYLIRFSHLVAGIAWIGSSFYFIWLDSSFEPLEGERRPDQRNVDGELFMVHGGFYYRVEKRKLYPGELPKTLHWFKWEATLTWVTGFLLLVYLYFLRGASLLIDPTVASLTQPQAVGLALAILIGAWLVYDTIWNPRWVKPESSKALPTLLSAVFFASLIYGLTRVFSGRGAFILTGAILGTSMLLNVWVRILPGQKRMFEAASSGQVPDYSASLKSKTRSVHNTYFIFPVLFIMLSNHYPQVYNHAWNWLLLIVLGVAGALTRHAMVTKVPAQRWTLAPAALGLLALVFMTGAPVGKAQVADAGTVDFARVQKIVETRCVTCHATKPTDDVWKAPPLGVVFETEEQLRAKADKIRLQVVEAKTMPLGNKTGMTDEERAVFAQWLRQERLRP